MFEKLPVFGNFSIRKITMGKNTSISLGDHFESFIENSLSKGRYTNVSEVVRAGLRLLEEEENRLFVLKKSIQEGMDSGRVEKFDSKKHLKSLKTKKKLNG